MDCAFATLSHSVTAGRDGSQLDPCDDYFPAPCPKKYVYFGEVGKLLDIIPLKVSTLLMQGQLKFSHPDLPHQQTLLRAAGIRSLDEEGGLGSAEGAVEPNFD